MATVTLVDVNKVFDNGSHVIHDLSLDIAESEFLVLVGPSGSGKSTALRMVAGLESITSGEIRIGDKLVNDVQPPNEAERTSRPIVTMLNSTNRWVHRTATGHSHWPPADASVARANHTRRKPNWNEARTKP